MTKINKLVYLLLLGLFLIPQAQAEWVDSSASVEITKSRRALDRVKRVLFSYVTVKNTSNEALADPVRLVITNPSIPVLNQVGVTESGDAYLQIAKGLAAGASAKIRVDFELQRLRLNFSTKIEQLIELADPQLLSHEFVELRGRTGHQGLFPLFSAPTSGDAKLHTLTNKAVKELTITVVTDFGNTSVIAVPGDTSAEDRDEWFGDIILPSNAFKLRFTMVPEYGEPVITESETITPRTFSLLLALVDGHTFSPGENNIVLSITNHSSVDESYEVLASGSENYLVNPLIAKTLDVAAGKTENLLIPILVPKEIDTHTLTVNAQVNEVSVPAFEEAALEILVIDEPLTLTELDSKVVVNPGACEALDRTQQTVKIAISGSSHLDVNNIDINTIEIIGDDVELINSELIDINTSADKPCDQQQADGKTDLLLTFNLQDILAENNNAESGSIYLSILYFTKTGMRYTHNGRLVFP